MIDWRVCSGHRLLKDEQKFSYHAIAVIKDQLENFSTLHVFRNIQEEKYFMEYFFEELGAADVGEDLALRVLKIQKQPDHGVYTRNRAMRLYGCVKLHDEPSRLKIDPAFGVSTDWRMHYPLFEPSFFPGKLRIFLEVGFFLEKRTRCDTNDTVGCSRQSNITTLFRPAKPNEKTDVVYQRLRELQRGE